MSLATGLAESRLKSILIAAEHTMRQTLEKELERLVALREVNPSIRQEEIHHLSVQIKECAVHIQHANLQLQALRLIITN